MNMLQQKKCHEFKSEIKPANIYSSSKKSFAHVCSEFILAQ